MIWGVRQVSQLNLVPRSKMRSATPMLHTTFSRVCDTTVLVFVAVTADAANHRQMGCFELK